MLPQTFLFYLVETNTGVCWYKDSNGNTQKASIQSGLVVNLKSAPDGWMGAELSFMRNATYYGINRSFSQPMKFVKDAASIVRELYYKGRGTETPLTLVIFKYNESPKAGEPIYKLYYKAPLDFTKAVDLVAESFQCNLMEGGVLQLLKTYENVVFEIPCDGSIPENIKANCDGLYLPDILHYDISFDQNNTQNVIIPCFFKSNDGDNFGVVHNDPIVQGTTPQEFINSGLNYYLQFSQPTTVKMKGQMVVRPYNSSHGDWPCYLALVSDKYPSKPIKKLTGDFAVNQQMIVPFEGTYDLDAYEKLYFWRHHDNINRPMAIMSGSFDVSFNSKCQATSPWGISAYDLFKLLVKEICLAASNTDLTFNYDAASQLLQDNLNLLLTSGDALRASGDANYQKFYKDTFATQYSSVFQSFGPVIKTSLNEFFKAISTILFASLSNQQLPGQRETLFIEGMDYVFNENNPIIDLGEVSNMKISPIKEIYNELEIGYKDLNLDQKSGKYEWNTKANWIFPIKTQQKKLSLISPYVASPYLIEKLRANIGGTSSSRNDNDNTVCILNIDRTKSSLDSQLATFTSNVFDYNNANNTNIRLLAQRCAQPVNMMTVSGTYLSMLNDPSIFVFSYPAFSASKQLIFTYSGTLQGLPANAYTGLPADAITIKLYINGVVVYTRTFTSTSAATAFADSFTVTQIFNTNDVIYATATTSVNGKTDNMQAEIAVGTGGDYWTAVGSSILIDTGTAVQLIAMPTVTDPTLMGGGLPVVSYGFQYFLFNSILINSTFNINYSATTILQAGSAQTVKYNLFKNGLIKQSATVNNDPSTQLQQTISISDIETFVLGDLIFCLADNTNLWAQVTDASIKFESTTILKYDLKRIAYDSINGIPVIAQTGPGAPFNIEDLSPKRLFNKWKSWFASILARQPHETVQFSTLTKNQFLTTTLNGETITENADVTVSDLGSPMWLPFEAEFDFKVPLTFSELLTGMPNAHVKWSYSGKTFYGYVMEMKQKPALNETQKGKFLLSPANSLQDLINLNFDGQNLINMAPNSISCPYLSPIQFVPEGLVLDPKYHTKDMNLFWFSEQVISWINQNNYWQPVQVGDKINLQFQTRDLTPVIAQLYNSAGTVIQTVNLTQKPSSAIVATNYLWEGIIDFTGVTPGSYFVEVIAGGVAYILSDGLKVSTDCPDTLLFEYSNSVNKQEMIFDTGFTTSMRAKGFFNNRFSPKYKGAFYVNQPQDISILNAIPYGINELWIGLDDGVPDYVAQKVAAIMLLDTVFIEGIQYSLDEGAEWEEDFIPGNPKKYWKTKIRPAKNVRGINVTATGVNTTDTSMIISVDANAVGPNAGNAANTINPEIINATIN